MIGLTAGEAKNPQKTIPDAIVSVFWRICCSTSAHCS
jgi:AAT family amino acid transporter